MTSLDAREKNKLGLEVLRVCAPFFLAWVLMFVWRVGFFSAMQISITLMIAVYVAAMYKRRSLNFWVAAALLVSSVTTLAILCVGAANAEKEPGSSLRQIGTDYQWCFLANLCFWGLVVVTTIRLRQRQGKGDISHEQE